MLLEWRASGLAGSMTAPQAARKNTKRHVVSFVMRFMVVLIFESGARWRGAYRAHHFGAAAGRCALM